MGGLACGQADTPAAPSASVKDTSLPKECEQAEAAQRSCTEHMASGYERLGQGADAALRDHRKSARLERIAGEQRDRLAECNVAARLAAPERVVVHARQIVMHERIGVHQLQRRRAAVDVRRIAALDFA